MVSETGGDAATTSAPGAPIAGSRRLVVPDVLRGVAIIAMLVAHAAPFVPHLPWAALFAQANLNALASPLFAVVMGMSAELLRRRETRAGVTLLQQGVRGLFLIALGVWMATWGSWVDVILAYLGVLLIVGAPLLLARTPVVLAGIAVLLVISQPVADAARGWTWVTPAPAPVRDLMTWIFLGQNYRLLTLLPMFLIGALLVRQGLRRGPLLWSLTAAAPLAYLAWPVAERLGVTDVRSGDYLDTLRDLALVFAVYVCVVVAATARGAGVQRFWAGFFVPLIACGQVALSLYLLHVGLIALWNGAEGRPVENFWPGWLVIVPGMILVGWLWWRFVGTGPVEWVMGWLTGRRKPLLRAH
ncbi:acyltransferase family protein [Microbacterium sp. NPDC090218]